MDRDIPLADLLAAARDDIASRTTITELARDCWPGASADRAVPAAAEWLRRWAPKPVVFAPPICECAIGRCAVCN